MNKQLLNWLHSNRNKTFASPRKAIFKTKAQDFEIIKVDEKTGIVEVEFKKKYTPLRLEFWRFETALAILEKNRDTWMRLGTRFDSNDPNTIEFAIQSMARKMHPGRKIDLKSAPHVGDVLVLSGIAEYGKKMNPITERMNQALRLKHSVD